MITRADWAGQRGVLLDWMLERGLEDVEGMEIVEDLTQHGDPTKMFAVRWVGVRKGVHYDLFDVANRVGKQLRGMVKGNPIIPNALLYVDPDGEVLIESKSFGTPVNRLWKKRIGKFSSTVDLMLYQLGLEGGGEEIIWPGGGSATGIEQIGMEDWESVTEEMGYGVLSSDEIGDLREIRFAIQWERDDGIVTTELFDSERKYRERWEEVEQDYLDFEDDEGEL